MTQPKLLIHIGPHKTGTTSIQAVASHQLPAISKAGWAVETFPELKNGTHSLASLLSNGKLDVVRPHLEKLGTITTPTLISSENFSRITEAQAKFMLNTIGISDVRVVYYLRNPLHRLLSAWTERVRHGYRRTLTEYIAGRLLQPFRDRDINDQVRITPWAHALGETAVRSGALDLHLYDQYDDVVKHFFFEYFGIAIDDSEENTRIMYLLMP
ncbi:MAG: sulfotransferase domain-containing protein [Haliea sp.]|nr:sulfotransferase domain-containing protein [Haliea sp.]